MATDTIAGLLAERADDQHRAVVFEDQSWTWAEVVSEASTRAALLSKLGASHVGVLLENVPEYLFLLFGAALAGLTVVGINPTRRGDELKRDVTHTDCAAVVTEAGLATLLGGVDVPKLMIDGAEYAGRLARHAGAPPPERLPGPDELYLLIFTAGSTGAPKAVRMTQGRAARTSAEQARAFSTDDVLYCAMPLFHGNGLLANVFPALISGATIVLRRKFSASAFLPDIQRYGCTFFNYVGRCLSYILAVPESPKEADNQLRWVLGAEASPQNITEFTRRYGCPVFEAYSSSEGPVVILPAPGAPPAAMGKPRKGIEVAILDPDSGKECVVGEFDENGKLLNPDEAVGEIVGINTADSFEGYYNNSEATEQRTRGGAYWTGDLGYRDAAGFIYFAGRTADWIRVDGENFAAGSVERILNRFPGTSGVAVYGVADPVTGDQVMAAIEMPEPDRFEPKSFEAFLEAQADLGTKWAPRFVRVTPALPVTGPGKVDKSALRREAWDVRDPIWWRPWSDRNSTAFRRFTPDDAADLSRAY